MDEVAWDEQSNMPPPIQLSLFLFFSALPNELKEEIKKELTGTAAPSGVWNWRMKFQQSAGASAIDECWFWFVFDWWVMGASSANGSAKRREPNQKPTMKSMKEEGNQQWMKWNEDSNKPINKSTSISLIWFLMALPVAGGMKRNGAPSQFYWRGKPKQNQTFLS